MRQGVPPPARVIVHEANQAEDGLAHAAEGAAGLVIGRAARAGEESFVRLGPVARRLLRRLPGPVVVAPRDLMAVPPGPILLATDLGDATAAALPFAQRLAARHGRPLELVHIGEPRNSDLIDELEPSWLTAREEYRAEVERAYDVWMHDNHLGRDRGRLFEAADRLRPRLIVLDPFVRLHRIDENTAAEVAPLLAYLRELQRSLGCAVVLVHHARKGGHARAGQALRGSSELHAWGDSNLYLRRDAERLLLSIEHRAAASSSGIELALAERGGGLTLHVREDMSPPPAASPPSPTQRILTALRAAAAPMTRRALREACHLRNATLTDTLDELLASGRVCVEAGLVRLAHV